MQDVERPDFCYTTDETVWGREALQAIQLALFGFSSSCNVQPTFMKAILFGNMFQVWTFLIALQALIVQLVARDLAGLRKPCCLTALVVPGSPIPSISMAIMNQILHAGTMCAGLLRGNSNGQFSSQQLP